VLGEVAEDVRMDLADHAVGVDLDTRLRALGQAGPRDAEQSSSQESLVE